MHFVALAVLGILVPLTCGLTINQEKNRREAEDQAPEDMKKMMREMAGAVLRPDWFRRLPRFHIPPTTYPEADYRVLPFAFKATIGGIYSTQAKVSELVSIATQCSVDYVHEMVYMARRWKSRISIGIFALESVKLTHHIIWRLRDCVPEVAKLVDFHIVFVDGPDVFSDFRAGDSVAYAKLTEGSNVFAKYTCDQIIQKGLGNEIPVLNMFGGNKKPPYPLGFMRNVARLYLRTPHQISLDTDIIPSPDLAFVYERAMNTYKEKNPDVDMGTVMFVPPAFEIDKSFNIPETKQVVKQLWDRREIMMFLWHGWGPGHQPTNYEEWFQLQKTDDYYSVDYQFYYEPFYLSKNATTPMYDNRFIQYGYDRMQNLRNLFEYDFRINVLRHGFVIHRGIKRSNMYHATKDEENHRNHIVYQMWEDEISARTIQVPAGAHPLVPAENFNVNRFPDEDPSGPIDAWLRDTVIPPRPSTPRVAMVTVVTGALPSYTNFIARTAAYQAKKGIHFFVFYAVPQTLQYKAPNVEFILMSGDDIVNRLDDALKRIGVTKIDTRNGRIGMEDLKGGSKKGDLGPMYGAMFEDYLKDYSHWGWFTFDSFFGDLSPLIKDLKTFDVVTYPNAYHRLQAIRLEGTIAVFRNIEYFRKFFGIAYQTKDGHVVEAARLYYKYGSWALDGNYAIWYALRHPDITLKCDYSQLEAMSNNAEFDTAFMFNDGIMSIRHIGQYQHAGSRDIHSASSHIHALAHDHSCLHAAGWTRYMRGWSFACIHGTAGFAYIWKSGQLSVELSNKNTNNMMVVTFFEWREVQVLDNTAINGAFVALRTPNRGTLVTRPDVMPDAETRHKWDGLLELVLPDPVLLNQGGIKLVSSPFIPNKFIDEDSPAMVNEWLANVVIPQRPSGPYSVALISLCFGPLPKYFEYFRKSLKLATDQGVTVLVFTTYKDAVEVNEKGLVIQRITLAQIATRVETALKNADAPNIKSGYNPSMMYNSKRVDGIKMLFGAIFEKELNPYSHWGFIDLDGFLGDMAPLLNDLAKYDVVTYQDGYHVNQAVYMSSPFTVFRNIEYFRKFFVASYRSIGSGNVENLSELIQDDSAAAFLENYGIWLAVRHPKITLKCDFSRLEAMTHNGWDDTSFLHSRQGRNQIKVLTNYNQMGGISVDEARDSLSRLQVDHSCLDKWQNFRPEWSFQCIQGAAGLAYIWDGSQTIVESSPKNIENTMYFFMHEFKHFPMDIDPEGHKADGFVSLLIDNKILYIGSVDHLPEPYKTRWSQILRG